MASLATMSRTMSLAELEEKAVSHTAHHVAHVVSVGGPDSRGAQEHAESLVLLESLNGLSGSRLSGTSSSLMSRTQSSTFRRSSSLATAAGARLGGSWYSPSIAAGQATRTASRPPPLSPVAWAPPAARSAPHYPHTLAFPQPRGMASQQPHRSPQYQRQQSPPRHFPEPQHQQQRHQDGRYQADPHPGARRSPPRHSPLEPERDSAYWKGRYDQARTRSGAGPHSVAEATPTRRGAAEARGAGSPSTLSIRP
jgi:hypothetical protein